MSELAVMWTTELERRVADTVRSTGIDPINWRSSGRKTTATPNKEDLGFWRDAGLGHVQAWVDWLDANPGWMFASFDGTIGIELAVDVKFGEVPVRGYIDVLMVDPDGQLICVDHKTGARAPEDHLQLALYACAVQLMGYPRPSLGAYFLTRTGKMTDPVSLDRFDVDYFVNRFAKFKAGVEAGIFLANPGQHCRSCSVKSSCYTAGGIDAWKIDPDSPHMRDQLHNVDSREES